MTRFQYNGPLVRYRVEDHEVDGLVFKPTTLQINVGNGSDLYAQVEYAISDESIYFKTKEAYAKWEFEEFFALGCTFVKGRVVRFERQQFTFE